jgi:glycopeptide antibiotics resistance protein
MLLGVFLEAAQMIVPGRTAGFGDLLYNLAGASLAFFLFKALRPLLKAIRNVVKKTSHHPLARLRRGYARDTENTERG